MLVEYSYQKYKGQINVGFFTWLLPSLLGHDAKMLDLQIRLNTCWTIELLMHPSLFHLAYSFTYLVLNMYLPLFVFCIFLFMDTGIVSSTDTGTGIQYFVKNLWYDTSRIRQLIN
jgi:hypothetical protein